MISSFEHSDEREEKRIARVCILPLILVDLLHSSGIENSHDENQGSSKGIGAGYGFLSTAFPRKNSNGVGNPISLQRIAELNADCDILVKRIT